MSREIKKEDLKNIETVDEAVARHIFYKEFDILREKLKVAESGLKNTNNILLSVVIILLVMVATLLIDSFHFNSATYTEYSQKTEAIEDNQKINNSLLKQIQELSEQNKKNQESIIELQKQTSKK